MRNTLLRLALCALIATASPVCASEGAPEHKSELSPAAVGWGNLVVPGLGATLRGDPDRGLLEAAVELGLFYGGTFGVREGQFTIDTTIILPQNGHLLSPLIGEYMQQVGIKLHMYNTFYQYQQACLAAAETDRERLNPQPLYKGNWTDALFAPFKWKNLSNPYVFSVILSALAYLFYDYKTNTPGQSAYRASSTEDTMYLMHNILVEPLGSSFGEEALFRGFIQRETREYTGSLVASLLLQSTLFALLHPPDARVPAVVGGLYFGILTETHHGDIEPGIATHFWINVINGFFSYLNFRRSEGKSALFSQPLGVTVSMPIVF